MRQSQQNGFFEKLHHSIPSKKQEKKKDLLKGERFDYLIITAGSSVAKPITAEPSLELIMEVPPITPSDPWYAETPHFDNLLSLPDAVPEYSKFSEHSINSP